VIPARPYKPRDKGANESGIGGIQKQFFQEVRDKTFYSLEELNTSFREYLDRLNSAVMEVEASFVHEVIIGNMLPIYIST